MQKLNYLDESLLFSFLLVIPDSFIEQPSNLFLSLFLTSLSPSLSSSLFLSFSQRLMRERNRQAFFFLSESFRSFLSFLFFFSSFLFLFILFLRNVLSSSLFPFLRKLTGPLLDTLSCTSALQSNPLDLFSLLLKSFCVSPLPGAGQKSSDAEQTIFIHFLSLLLASLTPGN